MAKVNLKKITPINSIPTEEIELNDGIIVNVNQYLPITDKMTLIESVLNAAVDDTGFFSPMRLKIFYTIELLRFYTNISITDKMMEAPDKLYDAICLNQLDNSLLSHIPESERHTLWTGINDCANAISTYQNSFLGMLKTISKDYDATKLDIDSLMASLDQPDKIGLVKDILDKIG